MQIQGLRSSNPARTAKAGQKVSNLSDQVQNIEETSYAIWRPGLFNFKVQISSKPLDKHRVWLLIIKWLTHTPMIGTTSNKYDRSIAEEEI
jgi:hypothetical protein